MPVGLVVDVRKDVCKVWSSASRRVIAYDSCEIPRNVSRGDWLQIRLDDAGRLERIYHCDREILEVRIGEDAVAVLDWFLLDVPAPASIGDGESRIFAYSSLLGFIPMSRTFHVPQITKAMAFKIFAEIESSGAWHIFPQRIRDSVDTSDRNGKEIVHDLERQMREDSSTPRSSTQATRQESPPPSDPASERCEPRNNEIAPWERESIPSRRFDQHSDEHHPAIEIPKIALYKKREVVALITAVDRKKTIAFAATPFGANFGEAILVESCFVNNPNVEKGRAFRATLNAEQKQDGRYRLRIIHLDGEPIRLPEDIEVYPKPGDFHIWCTVQVVATSDDGRPISVVSSLIGVVPVQEEAGRAGRCRRGDYLRARIHGNSGEWKVFELRDSLGPPLPLLPSHGFDQHDENFQNSSTARRDDVQRFEQLRLGEERRTWIIISNCTATVFFGSTPYGDTIILQRCVERSVNVEKGRLFRGVVVCTEQSAVRKQRLRMTWMERDPVVPPSDIEILPAPYDLRISCTVRVESIGADGTVCLWSTLVGRAVVEDRASLRCCQFRVGSFVRACLRRVPIAQGSVLPYEWAAFDILGPCGPPLPLPLGENFASLADLERRMEPASSRRESKRDYAVTDRALKISPSKDLPPKTNERYENGEWITALVINIITQTGRVFMSSAKCDNIFVDRSSFHNPVLLASLRPGMFVRARHWAYYRRDGTSEHTVRDIDSQPPLVPADINVIKSSNGRPEVICTMRVESCGKKFFALFNEVIGTGALMAEDAPSWLKVGDVVQGQLYRIGEKKGLPSHWKVSRRQFPIVKVEEEMRGQHGNGNECNEDARECGNGGMGSLMGSLLEMDSVREALAREGRLDEAERMLENERQNHVHRKETFIQDC